jgi:hypothetical protein
MPSGHLSHNSKIVIASTTTLGAAGATAITSSAVDTAGFDGCLFIVPFGAIVSGAVTSIKVQQCDTTGGSYADLEGSSQTVADTDDDKAFYVDIFRPREQFLKLVVSRATQNATVGGIIAVLYSARNRPTTHGTNVSGETFNWPAEGTA